MAILMDPLLVSPPPPAAALGAMLPPVVLLHATVDRRATAVNSSEPGPRARVAEPCEFGPVGVEYLVRAARVTDIDRFAARSDESLRMDREESPLGSADLLRQLVYLPQAS